MIEYLLQKQIFCIQILFKFKEKLNLHRCRNNLPLKYIENKNFSF